MIFLRPYFLCYRVRAGSSVVTFPGIGGIITSGRASCSWIDTTGLLLYLSNGCWGPFLTLGTALWAPVGLIIPLTINEMRGDMFCWLGGVVSCSISVPSHIETFSLVICPHYALCELPRTLPAQWYPFLSLSWHHWQWLVAVGSHVMVMVFASFLVGCLLPVLLLIKL